MTVPVNNVSLLDLQNEFGGSGIISLSEYYAGGPYVSNPPPSSVYQTAAIPTSGPISLGCFKGVTKIPPVVITPPAQTDMYGHSNGPWDFSYSRSYNATNIHFILTASGGYPTQNGYAIYTWSWVLKPGSTDYYSVSIRNPQDTGGSELYVPPNQTNASIKDFVVEGDRSGAISTYIVTVTDGITSASIELGVGLYW